MQVTQIYELINTVNTEVLGKSDIVAENLSNVVDIGTEIFDSNQVDNYVRSVIDHIGQMVFVDRKYAGRAPSVLMDGWEFGSVLEKVQMEIPEVTENAAWQLTNGQTYNQDIFYQPVVTAKFFNSKTTYEIPMSFTDDQVKEAFSNAQQLNSFISMIYNTIDKAITINTDALIMRTINNFIGVTLSQDYPDEAYGDSSHIRSVNLLYLYNQQNGTTLTADAAIRTPEFIRFAAYVLKLYKSRMSVASSLFNIGGKVRFTPSDKLHIVTLGEFADAADIYLQSDTFHNELTALPNAETVPYWQGTGTDYAFDSTSAIHVNVDDISDTDTSTTVEVVAGGILAVMFDRDALAVCNTRRRVLPHYNARGDFLNNFYKVDAQYLNDTNENFVVFFVADATAA